MRSMTGFGTGTAKSDNLLIVTEIKSVNSRFLEITFRSDYSNQNNLENISRQVIKENASRGKFNVYVSIKEIETPDGNLIHVDEDALGNYIKVLSKVAHNKKLLKSPLDLSDVLLFKDEWLKAEKKEISDDEVSSLFKESIAKAVQELVSMRETEGCNLKEDLTSRIDWLRGKHDYLVARQNDVIKSYETRLRSRIEKIFDDQNKEIDERRILEEVAIFADKTDYTEEVVRFSSHLDQFQKILNETKPVGKKLDFLLQEINREVNTMGSKTNDNDIIDCVIMIKTELEKIREQVQNIE